MSASNKPFRSALAISRAGASPTLDTHLLFDSGYSDSKASPLDEFLTRIDEINKLTPHPNEFNIYQGQLILLGAVAAVESFIRTLFRKIINIDPEAQSCVHGSEVSFGAALHLKPDLLPEAILERISFAGRGGITEAMKSLLGVKGALPPDLKEAVDEYARICHLRHCAVHRFGKLGANNAIALGLDQHKALIEKPLTFDYASLQNGISIITGFVKTINNFLFNEILSRVPRESWTGRYNRDRALFLRYYALFVDSTSVVKSAPAKDLHRQFMNQLGV